VPRHSLELADIFHAHGPAWRQAIAGHVSLTRPKVMSAIEACRTEALGGQVAVRAKCGHHHIAYNSCKNRHCPKCQGPAARDWMAARAEDLLPLEYFHVVCTVPAEIAQIAFWNKKSVYDLLFRASAQTVMTIAADPKRLGARVGMTAVLHIWGSALTYHPHIHMIVSGGGLSPGGIRWVACRPGFLLHAKVLSRLFRRLFLDGLLDLHRSGQLIFFGAHAAMAEIGARLPSHPPIRPARLRRTQVQHCEDPHLAEGGATRGRTSGHRRDQPAHLARTVPLLWRPHADRRDLPAGAKAAVTGSTTGAGGMMRCLSIWLTCRRFLFGSRAAEACPRRRNPLKIHVLHGTQRPEAPVSSGGSHRFAQPFNLRQSLTPTAATTSSPLSP